MGFASFPPVGSSGGGGGGSVVAAGISNIGNGNTSVTVVYGVGLSGSYCPVITIVNTVDSTPIELIARISAFDAMGFTAIWDVPTDSANYKLQYIVSTSV